MKLDVDQIESLNYLFLRVVGKVFLAPHPDGTFNEMTGAQKRILFFLDLEGAQKMSDVARLVGVTMPCATAVVDKLVRAGLVQREADPADRRVIRVKLTAQGQKTIDGLKELHRRRLAELLESIEPEQRVELIQAFEKIHAILSAVQK